MITHCTVCLKFNLQKITQIPETAAPVNDFKSVFESVDIAGRAILVWEQGEYLFTRQYYGNSVNLYAMPGFYAEITYAPDKSHIVKIEAIQDFSILNEYLPFIEIKV